MPLPSASMDSPLPLDRVVAEASVSRLDERLLRELFLQAEGEACGITAEEFAAALERVGNKYHWGVGSEMSPTAAQVSAFSRSLQLRELALAHACSLGKDAAWRLFVERYRSTLRQAAVAIAGSASIGEELADSLYSELFGLTERDGVRRSPLASYSGRGSLMGWLRATLAQRFVDRHRRTRREVPIEAEEFVAEPVVAATPAVTLTELDRAVDHCVRSLGAEERFLLASYFLDERTLLEISRMLRVHEATVSRKLKRLTGDLRKQILKRLEACGMSRRAAQEALGTDPRDLSINLRNLLQPSRSTTFSVQPDDLNR